MAYVMGVLVDIVMEAAAEQLHVGRLTAVRKVCPGQALQQQNIPLQIFREAQQFLAEFFF